LGAGWGVGGPGSPGGPASLAGSVGLRMVDPGGGVDGWIRGVMASPKRPFLASIPDDADDVDALHSRNMPWEPLRSPRMNDFLWVVWRYCPPPFRSATGLITRRYPSTPPVGGSVAGLAGGRACGRGRVEPATRFRFRAGARVCAGARACVVG